MLMTTFDLFIPRRAFYKTIDRLSPHEGIDHQEAVVGKGDSERTKRALLCCNPPCRNPGKHNNGEPSFCFECYSQLPSEMRNQLTFTRRRQLYHHKKIIKKAIKWLRENPATEPVEEAPASDEPREISFFSCKIKLD